MRVAVTTSKDDEALIAQARDIAGKLEIAYLPRERRSLEKLKSGYGLDYLLVVEKNLLTLKGRTVLRWHPGMAVPRIKALREGQTDHMVEAMGLRPGFQVLDCTMGLGSDTLVAAYAVGPGGHVTGLEKNKYIACLTTWGMTHFRDGNKHIREALERISLLNEDYMEYLTKLPAASFDTVYFDPMFRRALKKSSSMNALRPLAAHEPLSPEAIREGLRVARYRVVMKEAADSPEFSRLGAQHTIGGNHSPIAYGIWEKEDV